MRFCSHTHWDLNQSTTHTNETSEIQMQNKHIQYVYIKIKIKNIHTQKNGVKNTHVKHVKHKSNNARVFSNQFEISHQLRMYNVYAPSGMRAVARSQGGGLRADRVEGSWSVPFWCSTNLISGWSWTYRMLKQPSTNRSFHSVYLKVGETAGNNAVYRWEGGGTKTSTTAWRRSEFTQRYTCVKTKTVVCRIVNKNCISWFGCTSFSSYLCVALNCGSGHCVHS